MRRDLDLIRHILLDIEQSGEGHSSPAGWDRAKDNGSTTESIHYHVQLLHDAGLIVADELVPGQWWPERITWDGHEFLDLARNEALWKEVTAEVESTVGSAPFQLVREVLSRHARDSLAPRSTRRK